MALKATTQRFGTGRRQQNAKRTPAQMAAYIARTYGDSAAYAWREAFVAGGLAPAAQVLARYRYSHR